MEAAFDELDQMLRRTGAPVDAAELHGALCGHLCSPRGELNGWYAHSLAGVGEEQSRSLRKRMESLASEVARGLRAGDMSFTPLLPDDETPLPDRAGALGEWCDGFLFGMGTARIENFDGVPDTVQEAIRDLVEIARIGVPAEDDESDEAAYGELVEYVRVAVQLIHDEFN